MTPRQIQAQLEFCLAVEKLDSAKALSIAAMGARGEPREVKKRIKEWSRE